MNTKEPATGYAYWISPDGSSKVTYSLTLLHAIDSSVNEAFRSIPRGGVEIAGILFGRRDASGLYLEAQRPIECQHAFGPSFALSEQDLAALRNQIASLGSDAELSGLRPLGWFVAHTRSPLQMSDRELGWFNDFFPEPGSIAVLVKPERFQPTRFGFLLRNASGQMERDAQERAVILPLQGQTAEPENRPLASIPAPQIEHKDVPDKAPVAHPLEGGHSSKAVPAPTPVESGTAEAVPAAVPTAPVAPARVPVREASSGAESLVGMESAPALRPRYQTLAQKTPSPFGVQSALVLLAAALLGCVAGYWAYLQLPSPVIPVSIRERDRQLIVEWPSAQTSGVGYAAIQVNDGELVSLTQLQKASGQAVISVPNGDVKIGLVAKHWLRDSRGIVRYLRSAKPDPAVTVH